MWTSRRAPCGAAGSCGAVEPEGEGGRDGPSYGPGTPDADGGAGPPGEGEGENHAENQVREGGSNKFVHGAYSPEDAALATGRYFLWILSPFYFVVSAKLVADGILRGISAMDKFMTATFTDQIGRAHV